MIYGICGPAESGKDTIARLIQEREPRTTTMSFAHPVKVALSAMLGVRIEAWEDRDWKEGIDPATGVQRRKMAQAFAQAMRVLDQNFWIKKLNAKRTDTAVIISDVRYQNEADWIRQEGGVIIGRPLRKSGTSASDHISETEWTTIKLDYEIPWVDDVEDLGLYIDAVVKGEVLPKMKLTPPGAIESWEHYVELTKATAINMTEKHAKYGLYEEIGEVFGKLKRIERGDLTKEEAREAILDELGDVCWYLAQVCPSACGEGFFLLHRTGRDDWFTEDAISDVARERWSALIADVVALANEHGAALQEVCERNIRKTYDRRNRNQTRGSGDSR